MLVDSHVHLNRDEFAADRPEVLARAADAGVARFLNVGYDLPSSEASLALARSDPRIFATLGVHPHDAVSLADADGEITGDGRRILDRLDELTSQQRMVAVGEIGLDYYRDLSPRSAQQSALSAQLALADRAELPVVFHIRDAYAETISVVEAVGVPRAGGVLHSFQGDLTTLRWAQANGLLVGIGGPVTYKNSQLPELLSHCTPEDLLLETDAPWLPPVPHRGSRNEPAYVKLTALKVAEIMGLAFSELAERTSRNFDRLFPRALSGPGA